MSARESSCNPRGLETLNKRAKKPSKKSKNIPKQTKKNAISNTLLKANSSAIQPEKRFSKVIKLGMCFFIFIRTNFTFFNDLCASVHLLHK